MKLVRAEENKAVKKAILKTVAFFDLFDYPLTSYEIWRYLLFVNTSLDNVIENLDDQENIKNISNKNGFYFLINRENIIKTRHNRYNFSYHKQKIAKKIAKIFRLIPWIKMIAVGNIVGSHNLKDESDIDLFIITKKSRIWLTRFFCVLIIKVLNLRPQKNNKRNKICLSFFISEQNLNLQELVLTKELNNKDIDIYFIYWLIGLVVIYDSDIVYKNFVQDNNWLDKYLPNYSFKQKNLIDIEKIEKIKSSNINKFLNFLEDVVKKIQLKIMPDELKNIKNKNTSVVVNDQIIKLHLDDRREEIKNNFAKKMNLINLQ